MSPLPLVHLHCLANVAANSNRGIPTNEAVVESYLATLNGKLDAYDAILSKQKYIAGDVRTVRKRPFVLANSHVTCRSLPSLTFSTCPTAPSSASLSMMFLRTRRRDPTSLGNARTLPLPPGLL